MTTTPTQVKGFTFYATATYLDQLYTDIASTKSGDRILLATMAFEPEVPGIAKVVNALCSAAKRGVDVVLSIDAYVFLVNQRFKPGPLLYRKQIPVKSSLPASQAIAKLQAAGVTLTITNIPKHRFSVPFAGRSHAKISIINDTIYLGGCNLGEYQLDCMVRWQDNSTADWLYELFSSRVSQPQTLAALGHHDISHSIGDKHRILFDVGVKKQSNIYKEALDIIDNAQDWLIITCQFFPNSTTAQHLKSAQARGVKIFPIFNHYSKHTGPHKVLQRGVTTRERMRMPANFFDYELPRTQTFLHAKIIASEKEAMLGSHNYVTAGVNFGTAEIALHSQDPAFGKAAVGIIADQIDNPELTKILIGLGIIGRH